LGRDERLAPVRARAEREAALPSGGEAKGEEAPGLPRAALRRALSAVQKRPSRLRRPVDLALSALRIFGGRRRIYLMTPRQA